MTVWSHGDRVTRDGGSTGTVHLFPDAGPDEDTGEVQWDGSIVADALDLVADHLKPA